MTAKSIPALCFQNIAPASELHAAFFAPQSGRPVRVAAHDHADFCELFLVMGGLGEQTRGDTKAPLQRGDLHLLRARDIHAIRAPADSALCWINIAFPERAWREFAMFAPVETTQLQVRLSPDDFAAIAALFEETLRAFVRDGAGDRHLLARFLGGVLPCLRPVVAPSRTICFPVSAPAWLRAAATAFLGDGVKPAALLGGVAYLRERSGVSATHLARAVQAVTGSTPTQWVNERRLDRAAVLLSVTARPPAVIAADCGFAELGYFYRLFRARFGTTPGAYRKAAHRAVSPQPF